MLWKVTATFVDAYSHVEQPLDEPSFARIGLMHQNQTLIVEETDGMPKDEYGRRPPPVEWLLKGYIHVEEMDDAHGIPLDHPVHQGGDRGNCSLIVIHSIVPYEPKKRAREQEALPPADDGNDDDLYN